MKYHSSVKSRLRKPYPPQKYLQNRKLSEQCVECAIFWYEEGNLVIVYFMSSYSVFTYESREYTSYSRMKTLYQVNY